MTPRLLCDESWRATRLEDREKLWHARHEALYGAVALRPGARAWTTDVCVPISRLAECVTETQKDIAASGLVCPIVGHVGDGNFHCSPLIDMENPAEIKAAEAFMNRLVERALAMEGTSTGEHGIGQGKMKYLEAEYGSAALEAMLAHEMDVVRRLVKTEDFREGMSSFLEKRTPIFRGS